MNRIRFKTYLTILPIVAATALSSGFLSFFESRAALTRLANRHLAYKAEQLRDFINNEWQVIEELGLGGDPAYRAAEEASFRSYAYSVLRSETEEVLVFGEGGELRFRVGGKSSAGDSEAGATDRLSDPLPVGLFTRDVFGEDRVGIAFEFPPFKWTIAIMEYRSQFFAEVDAILRNQLWILAAAVSLATALSAVYLGYILGPLERLTGTIERITATGDLSLRARAENRDEIGLLGVRFNGLIDTVDAQKRELFEANRSERDAHETTLQREAETLFLLGRISDYNDEKTGAHLLRIGSFSALFSRLLGQGDEVAELMRACAPLHDIGKIGIPESILLKPGKLTSEEYELMKRHTTIGYDLLRGCQSRYLAEGADIAYTHHERWDGGGYPRGIAGDKIPLAGRIVSIVDVFDALVSDRPYKAAWTTEHALEYIVQAGGKQFDPALVEIFRDNFERFAE